MSATSLGSLFVELLFEDARFREGLKEAQSSLTKFGASMEGLTSSIATKFESAMKGAALALSGVAAASAVVGASFEQEITKVAVLAGGSIDELSEAARRMGSTTKFSATEAATAMESLAQAGFKTEQIIAGTDAALALAASSGGDLAQATKIVATTMSQFSLSANQAGRISDVFTQALNTSQLGMEELTVAMSYAGTVGASFGMSLEETTAAVAMFSNLGLEGSKAGTAFRMSMSAAANVTKQSEEVLARFGLTAKDINPELYSFGEILRKVGESGMSTSAAMRVFGTEVGGNVAALAQQAVAADRTAASFEEIRDSLQGSAGVAEQTAKAMTQTVSGAFEEMSGAFEEVLLTLYDQYAGPLRALLGQVGSFLNETAYLFQIASGEIRGGFADALGEITEWLRANQTSLAATIVAWTAELLKVGKVLASLIPYLDEIATLFAAIWVASKIASFVSALSSAYSGVVALQGAVAALAAELGIATGGLYAVAVAVGVVVAGLVALVSRTNAATVAAERLTEAQTKQAALSDEGFRREVAALESVLLAQQERARAELSSGRRLTDARRQELQQVLSLDAAQAALLVRQGRLVVSSGELRTAASLVEQAFDDADPSGLAAGMDELAAKQRRATEEAVRLAAAMGHSREEIADLVGVDVGVVDELGVKVSGLRKSFEAGQISAENFGGAIGAMSGQDGIATIEDARIRLDALVGTIGDARKAQVQLRNDVALAQRAMLDSAEAQASRVEGLARDTAEFSKTERKEAAKAAADVVSERERAAEASAKLLQQVSDAAVAAGRSEVVKRRIALDQQIRDVAATFDAEIALWAGHADQIEQIEARKQAAIGAVRERAAREVAAAWEADVAEALDAARQVEAAAKAAMPDIEKAIAAVKEIQPSLLTFGWLALREAMTDVVETVGVIGGAVGAVTTRVEGLVSSLTGFSFSIRGLMAEVVRASGEASDAGKRFDAAGFAASFVEGLFEQADRFADLFVEAVPAALDELAKGIPGLLRKVADSIPIVVDAIVDSVPEVTDALLQNLGPILDAIVAGIVDLVRAGLSELPNILRELLGKILPDLITTLSRAIPEIIEAIVDAIPLVLQAIIDAIPKLISAIIDAIPRIVLAVVEAIPAIIQAIVEAIPDLVSAIVEQIPYLIEMVTDLVPEIIVSLAESLPELLVAVVEMIPDLIDAIIEALPEITFALVEGLIETLVKRMPEIIVAVVEGLLSSTAEIGRAIGEAIFGGIGSNPLKKEAEDRKGVGKLIGAIGDLFRKKDPSTGAYSGMEYVPATMRTIVHQGERIVPAHENVPGRAAPAPAGLGQTNPGRGGAPTNIELSVIYDSAVLDGALVTAMGDGRAPRIARKIRSAGGGTIGLDRGKFSPWSR